MLGAALNFSTSDIYNIKMLSRLMWVILLCLSFGRCLKLVVTLPREDGPVCFSQYLTANEKYSFQTSSRGHINYRMEVQRALHGGDYEGVVAKEADSAIESVNKLADREGTYRFCVVNKGDQTIKMFINIMTGLELANLDYLPNSSDQQNLHREIDWLDGQKKTLFDALNRIENVRTTADSLNSKMNTSYIVLAVLGLLAVLAVNFLFYTQTRKTLKDRKLI